MSRLLRRTFTVKDEETASAIGSGGLPVLSTPAMIVYMENVAMTLMRKKLNENETTVGIEINARHLAPTAVGQVVQVKAEEVDVQGKISTFVIEASVDGKTIGRAMHKRAIVDRHSFMHRLKS